jgi:hypothetical protein
VNDNQLILQFSTAAPEWRRWVPKFLQRPKALCVFGDKNWGSVLIRRGNHSPFSHVDIVLEDGNLLGASNSPLAPVVSEIYPKSLASGVAVRPPNYQKFKYRRCMILETDRATDIRRIALSQNGKIFDNTVLKDFLSDSFPGARNWRINDSWFCAELVVWAMEVGGFWPHPLEWPKNRISPTDILLLCLCDSRWVNRETFWQPIPGLKLEQGET